MKYCLFLLLCLSCSANASLITLSDFISPSITDFNSEAQNSDIPAPFVVDEHTFDSQSGVVRILSLSNILGTTGRVLTPDSELDILTITLATPAARAGLTFGSPRIQENRISFFNGLDLLYSEVVETGLRNSAFRAWDAKTASITRIVIEDLTDNDRILLIDDLVVDSVTAVASPPMATFFAFLCALVWIRKSSNK